MHGRGEPQKLCVCSADFFLPPRIKHFTSASYLHFAPLQQEIGGCFVCEELIAGGDGAQVVLTEVVLTLLMRPGRQETVAAGPFARPLNAPLQRTHYAVVVHRREARLPVVHPASVERGHSVKDNNGKCRDGLLSTQLSAFSTEEPLQALNGETVEPEHDITLLPHSSLRNTT